eukprot:Nitzschia sp. Nitz4//scaffold32_size149145//79711//81051//NITZ4_002883-RA/size149145-processed-gene-0.126-mRNA-1//-1//CDS//3329548081//5583//frame0
MTKVLNTVILWLALHETTTLVDGFVGVSIYRSTSLYLSAAARDQGFDRGLFLSKGTSMSPLQIPLDQQLDSSLIESLASNLGIESTNEIQAMALEAAASGDSVVTVAQTGSGKTMTFLLPMLQAQLKASQIPGHGPIPTCTILAPNDVLLEQHAHVASQLHSKNSIRFQTLDDFLLQTQQDPSNIPLILGLDEVDAIIYQRPEEPELTSGGERLMNLLRCHNIQCLATTAYLSPAHEQSLFSHEFPNATVVREMNQDKMGWLVPTLRQSFIYFSENKGERLSRVLDQASTDAFLSGGSTIVFCNSVQTSQQVFDDIGRAVGAAKNTLLLHEDQSPIQRKEVLVSLWQDGPSVTEGATPTILVTTDLAARGLDVPNVRHVILYDVPTDLSSFVHQAGRTARRGRSGLLTCLVMARSSDMTKYQRLHALKDAMYLSFSKARSTTASPS